MTSREQQEEQLIDLHGMQTGMTKVQRQIAHRRRKRALPYLKEVMSGSILAADVKRRFDVSSKTLTVWMRKLQEGPEKIIEKPRSGRFSKLGAGQYDPLRDLYNRGALAAGFETDLWDAERFIQATEKAFKIKYSVITANRYILVFDPTRSKCIRHPRGPKPKSAIVSVAPAAANH